MNIELDICLVVGAPNNSQRKCQLRISSYEEGGSIAVISLDTDQVISLIRGEGFRATAYVPDRIAKIYLNK